MTGMQLSPTCKVMSLMHGPHTEPLSLAQSSHDTQFIFSPLFLANRWASESPIVLIVLRKNQGGNAEEWSLIYPPPCPSHRLLFFPKALLLGSSWCFVTLARLSRERQCTEYSRSQRNTVQSVLVGLKVETDQSVNSKLNVHKQEAQRCVFVVKKK